MKLNDIRPAKGAVKKRKRIGCGPGSGHGKTATKGHKGQNARSGGGVPPWFEGGQMPLQRRVPKRGFTNIFKVEFSVLNVADLERVFDAGTVVDAVALRSAGLVKGRKKIKVLGNGDLSKKLTVHADKFSSTARSKIEAAGGTCQEIQ